MGPWWVEEKPSAAVQILHHSAIASRTYQTIPNNHILATMCAMPIFCGVHRVWFLPCFATSLLNEEKQVPEVHEIKTHFQIPRPIPSHSRFRYCHVLAVGFLHDHQQVSIVCHFGRSLHWFDVGQHVILGSAHEGHSNGIPWWRWRPSTGSTSWDFPASFRRKLLEKLRRPPIARVYSKSFVSSWHLTMTLESSKSILTSMCTI